MKRTIIIAHPGYETWPSKNTRAIVQGIKKRMPEINVRVLPEHGNFDISAEQEHLLDNEEIFFAFPTWWYTSPWSLKKYMDTVIAPGFAFGYTGDVNDFKLKGKKFGYISSVGSPSKAYGERTPNMQEVETFNRWLDSTFHFISTAWLNGEEPATIRSNYMYEPTLIYGAAIIEDNTDAINKGIEAFISQFN